MLLPEKCRIVTRRRSNCSWTCGTRNNEIVLPSANFHFGALGNSNVYGAEAQALADSKLSALCQTKWFQSEPSSARASRADDLSPDMTDIKAKRFIFRLEVP